MNLPSNLQKISSKKIRLIGVFLAMGVTLSFKSFGLSDYQNLLQLNQEIDSFLSHHYESEKNHQLTIKLGNWDRRLRLTACKQAIDLSLQDSAAPGGNVTVNCRCPDTNGWSVHLPAQVDIYQSVAVANETIPRGKLIQTKDLAFEIKNISLLPEKSFTDPSAITGKAAKRLISKGDSIRPSLLDQPKQVNRGEQVRIVSNSGNVAVVMQGIAMSDGKMGQRIRVKNAHSERIISAKVNGPASVETL